jgi:hypothetical protein
MAKVILTIHDTPGENFQIVVAGDPPLPIPAEGLPDPDDLTPAQCAAIEMVAHISGLTGSATFVNLPHGSSN